MEGIALNPVLGEDRVEVPLVNRCGAKVLQGELVCVNAGFAGLAGQNMVGLNPGTNSNDAAGYWAGAAINPTTVARDYYVLVALEDVPDDATGRFGIKGEFDVYVPTGAAAGDFIHATNASRVATVVTRGNLDALAAPTGICGHLLQANASGVNAKVRVRFNGEVWKHLIGGGA